MLSDQIPYYILDLLQQAPSVQVAGLGRFEAIFHPAVVDVSGGRIKPPFVKADFQEGAPQDHHLLTSYICYVSGASRTLAEEAIASFVNKVHEETQHDKVYVIDKFGAFVKAASEPLRFTPDWDAFNLSFRGLEAIPLETVVEKKEPALPPVDDTMVYTPPAIFSSIETVVPEPEKLSVTPLPDIIRVEPKPDSDFDQNTSKLWWMILISAIILITVLCTYLAWDILSNRNKLDELRSINSDSTGTTGIEEDNAMDSIPIAVYPAPSIDTTPVAETPVEPEKTVVPEPSKNPGADCYVVVGAFVETGNIEKMVQRLHALGYTSELLKSRTLTRVAIRTSCESVALQQVLNEARASINPESWIY